MDFGAPGGQWVEMLQGAIGGAQHPALRTGTVPYQLVVPTFIPDRIAVVAVQGREAVNELYEYDVQVVSPFPPEVVQPAIFGEAASLVLRTPGHDARVVQGIIVRLSCLGVADRGLGKGLFQYEMTVAPPMWLWTQRDRNRVFQDKSVIEVATAMLEADKMRFRWELEKNEYPKRALYYQREETDFDFFKRVLADAGICFFFNHAVHDDTAGGAVSDVATAGAALSGVGSAVSTFGGKAVGAGMSNLGGKVSELTKGVTMVVLGDDDGAVVPLQDFAAASQLADQAVKKALGTVTKPMFAKASVGIDASDPVAFDDGYGAPQDERLFSVELERVLRPKSAWMVERDRRAPQSWAHIQRNERLGADFDLDMHLRMTTNGVGVDGGAKISMDIDAPWIDPKKLERELIQRNSAWLDYPSASRPKELGSRGIRDTHAHLKHPLEQLRRDAQTATVTTSSRRLGAGYRFNVDKHPSAAFNIELTVLSLTVDAVDPEMLQLDPKDPRSERPFIATMTCAPADDYAPRPPIPPRRKYPMELATVIRWQESMDMVTASRNEVYVRLDWDVERDESKEQWYMRGRDKAFPLSSRLEERHRVLRVPIVQPWAGNGYGLQVVPREGMQVLIGFIDSQGDRPMLLGCLHTDQNPPPWGPGYDAQRVGFRTQSRWPNALRSDQAKAGEAPTPTGYSEISISDANEEEEILIHAQKDINVTVGNNETQKVEGNSSKTVHGSVLHDVGGSVEEKVAGGLSRRVGLDTFDSTIGHYTQSVGLNEDRSVSGDATLMVAGTRSATIGTPDAETTDNHHVYGDYILTGTGHAKLSVDKELIVTCGETVLRITPDGLQIQAKNLSLGAETLTLESKDGSTLILDKQATMVSKSITLTADKASVVLSSDAVIQGQSVSLKKPGDSSSKSKDKSDDDKDTKTLKVKLLDGMRKPIANKHYHLFYDTVRIEGTTRGDGVLEAKLPKTLVRFEVIVWLNEYPKGERARYVFHLGTLPDIGTDDGVRARLHALGYDVGIGHTNVQQAMSEALAHFQREHAGDFGVKPTGTLDDDTRGALGKVFSGEGAEAVSSADSNDGESAKPADGNGNDASKEDKTSPVAESDGKLEVQFGYEGTPVPTHPNVRHVLIDDPANAATASPATGGLGASGKRGPEADSQSANPGATDAAKPTPTSGPSSATATSLPIVGLNANELEPKDGSFTPKQLYDALRSLFPKQAEDLSLCFVGQALGEQGVYTDTKTGELMIPHTAYNYWGYEDRAHKPFVYGYTSQIISVETFIAKPRKDFSATKAGPLILAHPEVGPINNAMIYIDKKGKPANVGNYSGDIQYANIRAHRPWADTNAKVSAQWPSLTAIDLAEIGKSWDASNCTDGPVSLTQHLKKRGLAKDNASATAMCARFLEDQLGYQSYPVGPWMVTFKDKSLHQGIWQYGLLPRAAWFRFEDSVAEHVHFLEVKWKSLQESKDPGRRDLGIKWEAGNPAAYAHGCEMFGYNGQRGYEKLLTDNTKRARSLLGK